MGRHFHWPMETCEAMPLEDLAEAYEEGVQFLHQEAKAKAEARRR